MQVAANETRLFVDIQSPHFNLEPDGSLVRRPTVIMLHGGPGGDHRGLRPAGQQLADLAQVIYYDQRGQGQSAKSSAAHWNLDTWADDLVGLCDALGIERATLVGTSFGGFVAQRTALRHPSFVERMVLVSTAARNDVNHIAAAMEREGGAAARDAALAMYCGPRDQNTASEFVRRCMPLYSTRQRVDGELMIEALKRMGWAADVSDHFLRLDCGEFLGMDHRLALSAVRCPVLILAGERDPVTPIESARELHASFVSANAELKTYPEASHNLFADAGASALADLRAFLQR